MSTRTTLRPYPVISAASMAADIVAEPTILQSVSGVSYTLSWSGTSPVGTIAVEGSNDYSLNPDGTEDNAGTWIPIYISVNGGSPASSAAITGNTGSALIEILKTTVYAIRLFYDATSGTGTLNAVINGRVS